MRQAVVNALLSATDVTGIVGTRVYGRQGLIGVISRDTTPEAFDADGRLMPTISVNLESAVIRGEATTSDTIAATQTLQVWVACAYGYTEIKAALKAVRRVLHRHTFTPVDDDTIRWSGTRWASTSPELWDEALREPTMFSRFDITYTEPI